jgi:hypothetical protein
MPTRRPQPWFSADTTSGRPVNVPAEFRAAVRQRLAELSDTARGIIAVLAVAGRAVPIAELAGLCDSPPGRANTDAVGLVAASGLVTSNGVELQFGHDLVRQIAYELMGLEDRRRIHSRLAQHFMESAADPVLAAAHARAVVSVGDEDNARIMVVAAEALVTTSAVDAADFGLQAFRTLRAGQPQWLVLGERALSVLCGMPIASRTSFTV